MLSIGEFSNICKVSTKTLRYYAEIGLMLPSEINPESGYRYYAIEQLETMLLINRLKSYQFSLEEIKELLELDGPRDEFLYVALSKKKKEIEQKAQEYKRTLHQLEDDLLNLTQGRSIMSYLEQINISLVDMPTMNILSIRKKVQDFDFPNEYQQCFGALFRTIEYEHLTITAPPMVLFHDDEFTPYGLDTEFAIPVMEFVKGTRDFHPGLCLKTDVHGSYHELTSVYAKQREWAEKEGYSPRDALFEVYAVDPSQVTQEQDLLTIVYYPVKKIR